MKILLIFILWFLFAVSSYSQLKVSPLTTNNPSTGSTGQVLQTRGDGLIQWVTPSSGLSVIVRSNGTVLAAVTNFNFQDFLKLTNSPSGSISIGLPIFVGGSVTQSTASAVSITSAAGLIENSGTTIGGFGAEIFNSFGSSLHDNSSNNGRLKAPTDGIYEFTAGFWFTNSLTGTRGISLRRNSSATLVPIALIPADAAAGPVFVTGSYIMNMVATEYCELVAYQNSGATMVCSNYNRAFFTIRRLGSSTGSLY